MNNFMNMIMIRLVMTTILLISQKGVRQRKKKALERKKEIAEFFKNRLKEIETEEQKHKKLNVNRPFDRNTEASPNLTKVQGDDYKTRSGRLVKKPKHQNE